MTQAIHRTATRTARRPAIVLRRGIVAQLRNRTRTRRRGARLPRGRRTPRARRLPVHRQIIAPLLPLALVKLLPRIQPARPRPRVRVPLDEDDEVAGLVLVAVFPAVLVPGAGDGEGAPGFLVLAELGDEVGGAVGDLGLGRRVPLDDFGGLRAAGCLSEALGEHRGGVQEGGDR